MKKFIKPVSLLFLGFSLLVAVAFLGIYIATPILAQRTVKIQEIVTQIINQPVKIESSKGIWLDSAPVLVLKNFVILDKTGSQTVLKISDMRIGFKLFSSILHREPILDYVFISGTQVSIQQASNNKLTIVGLSGISQKNNSTFNLSEFLSWITSRQKIHLDNILINWQKPDGRWVQIPYFAFDIYNGWYEHHASLKVNGTDVGALFKGYVYKGWKISEGWVNTFTVHWGWSYQSLNYVKGSVDAKRLSLIQPSQLNWHFSNLAAHFLWRGKINDQWFIKLTRLQFNLDEQDWVEKNFQINAFPIKKGGNLYTLRTNDLNLTKFSHVLKKLNWLPNGVQNLLEHLKPQGDLKNIYLEYPQLIQTNVLPQKALGDVKSSQQRVDNISGLNWKFVAEIHNLSFSPWQKIPGVQKLTGYLQVSETMGQLRLDSEKMLLTFPEIFRSSLFLEHAQADIDWQVSPSNYKINVGGIQIDNIDAKFKGEMGLSIPKTSQSPYINLCGEFNLNPNSKIPLYLPVPLLKHNLIKWLEHAFPTMAGASGTLVLRGPLNAFPFPNKEGTFAVHSEIRDLVFNYLPGWPIATHVFAKLNFDGPKISIFIKSANILKSQIKSAYGEIPFVMKGVDAELKAKFNAIGDLRDIADFLLQSPLSKKLGSSFSKIKFDGDSSTTLSIDVPLENDKMPLKLSGNVDLSEAKVTLPIKKLAFENIMGMLYFTQDGIWANNVRADFLNNPIVVNIQNDKNIQTIIRFTGSTRILDLQKALQLNSLPTVEGNFAYQAKLVFQNSVNKNPNQLLVTSDLKGMSVALPSPFNKSSSELMPSKIGIDFGENRPINFSFNYGKQIKGVLKYNSNNFELDRGAVLIGLGEVKLPSEAGIWVTGSLPNFNWEEWKNYFQSPAGKLSQKKSGSIWPKNLKKIILAFKKIELFGQNFEDIKLDLSRSENAWILGIDNPIIVGNIEIPDSKNTSWKVFFQKIYLKANTKIIKNDLNPKTFPALNFRANDFRYGNKQFGKVQFILIPIKDGLKIQNLSAESSAFSLSANGHWQLFAARHDTYFSGQMVTYNLGETLLRLGMPASMLSRNGKLIFKLGWPGVPYNPSTKLLSGNFSLALDNGRIVNIGAEAEKKIGLGELLNFFSLQNLSRHLSLDFSNVSKEGFPFDVMRGNFVLKNGNIYTQDTYLEGAVARISMRGLISLPDENYDLYLSVTPYITSSLPVVATIAGGPVVGVTAWVADKLLSKHVAKIMTYSYRMSGPWEKPAVIQVGKENNN